MIQKSAAICSLGFLSLYPLKAAEPDSIPADLPDFGWNLTARPWNPSAMSEKVLLDQMEKALRTMVPLQQWKTEDPNDKNNGAIIDPFIHKEVQYGTPLFAFNIATLATFGRCEDLIEPAARAMDRATLDISDGKANDYHGEFFCAPMVKALRMLEALKPKHPEISDARLALWKQRMKTKRQAFMDLKVKQNWRTFAMKGEWLRQQDGYIDDGEKWIEACWTEANEGGQRERFRRDLDKHKLNPHFFLYHDDTADPETFAYNGATTANLLDFLESGYKGPSTGEMRQIIARNLRASLFMLSGSGEAAGGGRTGEHIWDDSIYANAFIHMAEISQREGNRRLAGQFRRAVNLLLESHSRFQQENGWFSITKNQFPPALKNRYATWSGIANYEGFTLACCSETLLATKSKIAEQATPSEIGGYVMQLDPEFASVFLNAGGMQAQLCTRGETDKYGGVQWHALGITRFSRSGWDGRLGPGAGHVNPDFSDGVTFSPTFLEDGKWKRVCLEPKRFEGSFKAEFVHPLLTRGTFIIAPVTGQSGPTFTMRLILTPDGALVDTASDVKDFGVVWPLFEFDGRTVMNQKFGKHFAATSYPWEKRNPVSKQAEEALLSGSAGISADRSGYHGEGLVKFTSEGGAIEWKGIDGGYGGMASIGLRYSLGMDPQFARRGRLFLNGKPLPDQAFQSTGSREFWHELKVPAMLVSGMTNTIRIEFDDEGAVIDELRIYPADGTTPEPDQQNFIALKDSHQLDSSAPSVRGGYGDFKPVRVMDAAGATVETFVYPRNAGDPDAAAVRASFKRDGADFSSLLGSVKGTLYTGRTSAGGVGRSIDINHDGKDDVSFDQSCAFILQLKDGRITAVETDRAVKAEVSGSKRDLSAHTPLSL